MIKGHCFTNLDGYECVEWPTEFVAVPRIGERVATKDRTSLKVVSVTHTMTPYMSESYKASEPYIIVELHR